jgi:hypothetical protein
MGPDPMSGGAGDRREIEGGGGVDAELEIDQRAGSINSKGGNKHLCDLPDPRLFPLQPGSLLQTYALSEMNILFNIISSSFALVNGETPKNGGKFFFFIVRELRA